MTVDADRISAAMAAVWSAAHLTVDTHRRGPVPLDRFFEQQNLAHVALPTLTRGTVVDHLRSLGVPADDLGDPAERLAGFLFTAGRVGRAFVSSDDILPRRRFTAAHELGHFLLHREQMSRFQADTDQTLKEADDAADPMEREANRFAAELLMPADVCRARADELQREHNCCPRTVLAYRLAAELLVSREAMRYRLKNLELGHE